MTRIKIAMIALACLAVGSVAAQGAGGEIKIGWIGPMTGDGALWGNQELNAIKMMVDDRNAAGGVRVGGRSLKLRLVPADDVGDANMAIRAAGQLISRDKVVAIIGPQWSAMAIAVLPLVSKAKVPLISTGATNPRLTVDESGAVNPFAFRTCFIDPYQGRVAAYYVFQRLGKARAAILGSGEDFYIATLAGAFKENFIEAGGTIVGEASYAFGAQDYSEALSTIAAMEPDVIFMPGYYPEVARVAVQARELGMRQLLFGSDGWSTDDLVYEAGGAGGALEGDLFVDHFAPDRLEQEPFNAAYKARFGSLPGVMAYLGHDAFLMLVDALGRAGSTDGAKIAKALESCDLEGFTGHIKIGPTHDPEGKDAWMRMISGADIVLKERFAAP